jgi:hypothetical protein
VRVVQLPNDVNKRPVLGVDFGFYEVHGGYGFPDEGVVSQYPWQSPQVQLAMRSLFNVKPNYTLVAISISDYGIKAHIERSKK